MSLSTWLAINAFFALFFGSMFTFWPRQLIGQSGTKLNDMAVVYARGLGGAILGFALINWGSRNFTSYDVIWWIVGANIVMHVVSGAVDWRVMVKKSARYGSLGFHFVIAAVFAYYLLFTR
jgi:hypothetical protein